MGKIVTIYLTDGEAKELQNFCEENTCTQYSALKMAVKELLHKETTERRELEYDEELESKETLVENEKTETEQENNSEDIKNGKNTSQLLRTLLKGNY